MLRKKALKEEKNLTKSINGVLRAGLTEVSVKSMRNIEKQLEIV